MKTIGLLGGMSWESTVPYYQIINRAVAARLGGFHSAKIVLYSVDFAEIERCQMAGDWDESARILGDAAAVLERGGADFVVLCTNTMHKVAGAIQARIGVPLLHIVAPTAQSLLERGITTVGLLGTRYTMEEDFYIGELTRHGITALVPDESDRIFVNDTIFKELCHGVISPESRARFVEIIRALALRGAGGVILGCTEIGLLVAPDDVDVPLFDTTLLHAGAAAALALA